MSNVKNGKAFEWAVAVAVAVEIGPTCAVVDSDPAATARAAFAGLSTDEQLSMTRCATLAASHIISRERKAKSGLSAPFTVKIQPDSAGRNGDVRDVLLESPNRTIGISCKNNHDAFKHSRLSSTIDFVKDWGLSDEGCSAGYWTTVSPVFAQLQALSQQPGGAPVFKGLPNLRDSYMQPIASAWAIELTRVLTGGPTSTSAGCPGLVQYVVGRQDFYKVIRDNSQDVVRIQCFNPYRSLAGRATPMPKSLLGINVEQSGSDKEHASVTHYVHLDGGYSFKFRLHTAERLAVPSLKFDVQAIGLPAKGIYQHWIDT